MPRISGPIASGVLLRSRAGAHDDASPAAVAALSTAKTGKPQGLSATGGTTSTIEDTGTWNINETAGAAVFVLKGPNAASPPGASMTSALIVSNTGDALTLDRVFTQAFSSATRYIIEPAGLAMNSEPCAEVFIQFDGGSAPSCDITLWRYSPQADQWISVHDIEGARPGRRYRVHGLAGQEIIAQVRNIQGSPSGFSICVEARPASAADTPNTDGLGRLRVEKNSVGTFAPPRQDTVITGAAQQILAPVYVLNIPNLSITVKNTHPSNAFTACAVQVSPDGVNWANGDVTSFAALAAGDTAAIALSGQSHMWLRVLATAAGGDGSSSVWLTGNNG
ncbi:MAG: hypothetical protein GMKNLPBB_00815 [Myxococcota bacterium]|nr:hypothetical protein [Myxococcota bacterium]